MKLPIYQVDSFTNEVFRGNPAGVCLLEKSIEESMMKSIAAEMAVSETAFLNINDYTLRWFTPEVEVALCGHGTLAAVCVLQELGLVSIGDSVSFKTLSGKLTASIHKNQTELQFPMPELEPTKIAQPYLDGLGLAEHSLVEGFNYGEKQLLIVNDESVVLELKPNFSALKALPGRGITVAAVATREDVDVVSRYFAPWVGVDEDPVTGTSHCALAKYFSMRLKKEKLLGYQASKRGGFVSMKLETQDLVVLGGQAVISLKGHIRV